MITFEEVILKISLGRVVVRKNLRGSGLGLKMMEEAINFMTEKWKAGTIKISAQKYLQKFYKDLGFSVVTKEYLEDGIPHLGMVLDSKQQKLQKRVKAKNS